MAAPDGSGPRGLLQLRRAREPRRSAHPQRRSNRRRMADADRRRPRPVDPARLDGTTRRSDVAGGADRGTPQPGPAREPTVVAVGRRMVVPRGADVSPQLPPDLAQPERTAANTSPPGWHRRNTSDRRYDAANAARHQGPSGAGRQVGALDSGGLDGPDSKQQR